MTSGEVFQKYQVLTGKVLSQRRVDQLYDTIQNLEKVSDVRELAELLVP
jgi:hypothetical protein